MVRQTESYVERMTREAEITRKAEEQARRLLNQAQVRSREIRAAANAYADDVLDRLSAVLRKALATVEEGRSELQATLRSAEPAPETEAEKAGRAEVASAGEPERD